MADGHCMIGVALAEWDVDLSLGNSNSNSSSGSWCWSSNGTARSSAGVIAPYGGRGFRSGDILEIEVDMDHSLLRFR